MSNNIKSKVVLVGTGQMAIDHLKALKDLKKDIVVVGRGSDSARLFHQKTGIKPVEGGFDKYLVQHPLSANDYIIVAVGTEMLMPILMLLTKQKFNSILIEKPAAISVGELLAHKEELKEIEEKTFVGYNRRFYSSVIEAEKFIQNDGGLKSLHFEFTEWAHTIEPLKKAEGVKENWFFANSTHVVDLAFYLAGNPSEWSCFSKEGDIKWHSKTNFSGAGITNEGVVFSYISNWESAGRWGIELMTNKRRIYLKPLEGVLIQKKGKIALEEHAIDNTLDLKYKPGLFLQLEAFFEGKNLLTLKEHILNAKTVYSKMLGESEVV